MPISPKNTTTPSIRTKKIGESVKSPAPAEPKDFIWYLKNVCGGSDKYDFNTHDEAYKFGWALREEHGDKIRVEISTETVRVFSV